MVAVVDRCASLHELEAEVPAIRKPMPRHTKCTPSPSSQTANPTHECSSSMPISCESCKPMLTPHTHGAARLGWNVARRIFFAESSWRHLSSLARLHMHQPLSGTLALASLRAYVLLALELTQASVKRLDTLSVLTAALANVGRKAQRLHLCACARAWHSREVCSVADEQQWQAGPTSSAITWFCSCSRRACR